MVHVRADAPKGANLPPGIRAEFDLSYIKGGNAAQTLDLYLPETTPDHAVPLIVHIHGGGWMGGDKYPCACAILAAHGYVVASIEYRFSQIAKFPAQIQDCFAALRWLRGNAASYHIDTDRVGVIGGSAGGHLAALIGTAGGKGIFPPIGEHRDQSERVQAVCDIFGPSDFTSVMKQAEVVEAVKFLIEFNTPRDPYSQLIGTALGDNEASRAVSPITYIDEENPPFLILHGTHDPVVPFAQSEELAAKLRKAAVPVWLQSIPGGSHGGPGFAKPEVKRLIQDFFDKFLQGKKVDLRLVPESVFLEDK